jgi:hypothetical protein
LRDEANFERRLRDKQYDFRFFTYQPATDIITAIDFLSDDGGTILRAHPDGRADYLPYKWTKTS